MRSFAIALSALALAACSEANDDGGTSEAEAVAEELTDNDSAETAYDGQIPRPITIGSDGPQMDACGTYAEVANLDPDGDNYLSVRDAPSTATKERDRLQPGWGVTVCSSYEGWSGIVYPADGQELSDCGTGSPLASERNYTGPCQQGWVDSRYLEMVAG